MVKSVYTQLAHDGITIDMLPSDGKYVPPKPEPKGPKEYTIYMITENLSVIEAFGSSEEEYVATFPTLNAAEKYARNKFSKKAYPTDWKYTIWGLSVKGNNKLEACNTLKEVIYKELEKDENEDDEFGRNYLDRIREEYTLDYMDIILYDEDDAES